MAVALWVLVKIVLMILLCRVEVLQGYFLDGQRLFVLLLLIGKHLFDDGHIVGICIENTGAIARSLVVSLLVEACGVDGLEEHL